jgi:hypothetical protein
LKLDGTHKLLICADGIKNRKAMLGASKEVGLEVTAENAKYLLMLCHRMQDKTVARRQIPDPLKSSYIW